MPLHLLADIYNKRNNFNRSVNKINNLCNSFRTNYLFNIIRLIVYSESRPKRNNCQERVSELGLYFSNIPSPFRLKSILGDEEIVSIYREQLPASECFKLFEDILNFDKTPSQKYFKPREIKYHARKLMELSRTEEAVVLYEAGRLGDDCALKRDYLIALVASNKLIKAAEYFLELSEEHTEAVQYFSIDLLHEKLLSNINRYDSIVVPLTLYIFRNIYSTSMNKNATALSLARYVRSTGAGIPSNIKFTRSDKKVIKFLEHVCNRDLLSKSRLFKFQADAYDERIKICNLLSSQKLSNVDKLTFEAKELSKRKVLNNAAKQVSNSKVYADKDFIRTNTWDAFLNNYKEFLDVSLFNEDIDKQLESALELYNARKDASTTSNDIVDLISRQLSTYLKVGDSKKAKSLYSLIKCVVEEYCFGIKGLNSYLSTRIRHGTLYSTLLGPLIDKGIVSDDKITHDNDLLHSVADIEKNILDKILIAQIEFNDSITSIVNDFVNNIIQIYANGKGNSKGAFCYQIEPQDLIDIQQDLIDSPTINECWERIDTWITDRTNEGCRKIQRELDSNISDALTNTLNKFELKSERLIGESELYSANEFSNALTQARADIFNQLNVIRAWFDIDYSIVEQEYTFDIAVDIAQTMLRANYIANDSCPPIKIPHNLLSPMVDLIYNLLSNAIKHSLVNRKHLDVFVDAEEDSDSISINMFNSTKCEVNIEVENKRLESFMDNVSEEELKNLLQKEGGTGIAKIISILKHDFNSKGQVKLKYISSELFCASIVIDKESGVTLGEYTNS